MDTIAPINLDITGVIADISAPYEVNGLKIQQVIIASKHNQFNTGFYQVFIYSAETIATFWENYNDKKPPIGITVTAKLQGKKNKKSNYSLTLIYKTHKWIYS
jgi:hypothetical protein